MNIDRKKKPTAAMGRGKLVEALIFKIKLPLEITRSCNEVFRTLTDDFCLALTEMRENLDKELPQ